MQLRQLLTQDWTVTVAALARQLLDHTDQAMQTHELTHAAALVAESRDGDTPTLIDFAQDSACGHTHLIEKDLVELRVPRHLYQRSDGNAWALHIYQKTGDALMLGDIRIGTGEQQTPVGIMGITGPDLRARDHKVVAILHSTGGQRRQVTPGARLGEALAPDFLRTEDMPQIARPLRCRTVVHEHRSHHINAHAVDLWWRSQAHTLLGKHHLLHQGRAPATILRGPVQAYPPAVVQPLVP